MRRAFCVMYALVPSSCLSWLLARLRLSLRIPTEQTTQEEKKRQADNEKKAQARKKAQLEGKSAEVRLSVLLVGTAMLSIITRRCCCLTNKL